MNSKLSTKTEMIEQFENGMVVASSPLTRHCERSDTLYRGERDDCYFLNSSLSRRERGDHDVRLGRVVGEGSRRFKVRQTHSTSSLLLIAALAIFLITVISPSRIFCAETGDMKTVERQFRELPADARRLTGPLFWLHGDESEQLLRMYVGKVAEGGNGCFTAESRPHNDWLGEGWYRDLAFCLDEAKKHNLQMWIFDEAWWPSGEVGGKVPAQYASKQMLLDTASVTGPRRAAMKVDAKHLIAVLAGKKSGNGIDGASLIDLTDAAKNGNFAWDAPEGKWEVLAFTWGLSEKRGINYLVDGASRDAVEWYIKTVYQPHYDRFPDDFGKAIQGYFYDEPETYGDWGTEVIPMLKERGGDWKRALVAWKSNLADPQEQVAARYQYQDALAEAWGRTLYGGVTQWCREHRVKSIGHFLEHGLCYLNQKLCAGNVFQLMKYSDMGGIDAVFTQFAMGRRIAQDAPCWQTTKLGSSITHAYGKPDDVTMVEIYGARGQDLTYPEMKWWADHMHVSGVNFLIPHSFNPRSPFDNDCPPYFYNNGHEPRWPLYRVFADYTSRLSVVLTGGRHVCPVALLYLGQSFHVGKSVPPDDMSERLQDALYDCDWIPYEVLENDMSIADKALKLRAEEYKILIVPPVEVIPYASLEKAKAFYDAGGVVVGYGFLPSKSATLGKNSDAISALREAVWGNPQPGLAVCKTNAKGGRSYLLPQKPTTEELQQVFAKDAAVPATLQVLKGETGNWLHVLHRVKTGCDVFFICNQNHAGDARNFRFRASAKGCPEIWDPLRNEIMALAFNRVDAGTVEFDLTLEPLESVLIVFQPEQVKRPEMITAVVKPLEAPISLNRQPWTGPAPKKIEIKDDNALSLAENKWVWYPDDNPLQAAPPGVRFFASTLQIPEGRTVAEAKMRLTADNDFVLFVNGRKTANGDNWQRVYEGDLKDSLRVGENALIVKVANTSANPNPAGLIGRYRVTLDNGQVIESRIDKTWKTSKGTVNPEAPDLAGADWVNAVEIAPFGAGPWGNPDHPALTLSPVEGDPFLGSFTLPKNWLEDGRRVFVEADAIAPEAAAAVAVNGVYAGGFIGKPLRLELTSKLKAGENVIEIQPFTPKGLRIVCHR
ncbi:MAG TPA: glycosyl hydrolase [Candidatus Brocadiia bacterium]|nr:glycosyl hydrolase [Candidatus Brocadiia bacterium]